MGSHQRRDERNGGRGGRLLGASGLGRQPTASAFETVGSHNLLDHAHGQALLESAELAPVPPPLVHGAVLVGQADVLGVLLHRPLEESLAALTGAHAVVLAGRVVAAHSAEKAGRLACL